MDSAWEQYKLEASLSWPTRVPDCVTVQAGQGKMLACTVPQAQVKMLQNPQRTVHAVLGVF